MTQEGESQIDTNTEVHTAVSTPPPPPFALFGSCNCSASRHTSRRSDFSAQFAPDRCAAIDRCQPRPLNRPFYTPPAGTFSSSYYAKFREASRTRVMCFYFLFPFF